MNDIITTILLVIFFALLLLIPITCFFFMFSYLIFEKSFPNAIHYFRKIKWAPSHGTIDEIPITGKKNIRLGDYRVDNPIVYTSYKESSCYTVATLHNDIIVRLIFPKEKIAPFFTILNDNPDTEFRMRVRFDPLTFLVYEVYGLVAVKKENKS